MGKSLLAAFATLDASTKESLADIEPPLLLSFAALDIAFDQAEVERLTAEHIVACLESAGVAVKKASISRALARAGDRVSVRKTIDGETEYKLMTRGRREIEDVLGGELMAVAYVEGGKPRTARLRLGEILVQLKGMVRLCDPYYGVKTLDTLDHLPPASNFRFLTGKTTESARKVTGAIRDFKKERPKAEFRVAAAAHELHDRYALTKECLLILGHGLKDIGGKESFVIRVDRELAPDLLNEVREKFDERWKAAKPL